MQRTRMGWVVLGLACVSGCAGRPSLLPNGDTALRKTSTEFAVDASHRFPYKTDAPDGGKAQARANIGYMLKQLDLVNLSSDQWTNVELWINQKYVLFVPKMMPNTLEKLPFQMFYDDNGHYFPTENTQQKDTLIKTLSLYRDGKMYTIPIQLAD